MASDMATDRPISPPPNAADCRAKSGIGILPMIRSRHGQDAHATTVKTAAKG